jgi:hypothetical protein
VSLFYTLYIADCGVALRTRTGQSLLFLRSLLIPSALRGIQLQTFVRAHCKVQIHISNGESSGIWMHCLMLPILGFKFRSGRSRSAHTNLHFPVVVTCSQRIRLCCIRGQDILDFTCMDKKLKMYTIVGQCGCFWYRAIRMAQEV